MPKMRNKDLQGLVTLAICIQICVFIYALLSTVGLIPSITYQYVYPVIRDIFNTPFVPLTFSEISDDGRDFFLSPAAIVVVFAIHFFDLLLYVSVTGWGLNLVSFLIIHKRLGDKGYKKLRSMQAIAEKRRLDNVAAVTDSYAHITLQHERENRKKHDSGKFGAGLITGLLLGFFISR